MKLALVIHRYGDGVAGGSEAHARGLAAALQKTHEVEVLTTCARDYLSWRNEFDPGETMVDGIRVTRFPVRRIRDLGRFAAVVTSEESIASESAAAARRTQPKLLPGLSDHACRLDVSVMACEPTGTLDGEPGSAPAAASTSSAWTPAVAFHGVLP